MGFRNRHEKAASERNTQDSPHTHRYTMLFVVFSSQKCQDGAWIKSGSNGAKGTCTRQEHQRDRKGGKVR